VTPARRRRLPRTRAAVALAALVMAAGLAALGVWQLERRVWKHALITAVQQRIHALPVAAPGPAEWSRLSATGDAYRRVRAAGYYDHARETLVLAVTDLGRGHWVLTPLRTRQFTVLVNRGFVPDDRQATARRLAANVDAPATVTGLLRISEPGGAFLHSNDPGHGRWYSRDVAAIARARGLGTTAPYFIDADATPNPGGYPVGGLTVVRFADNHLVYALTWFALAALALFAAWRVLAERRADGVEGNA